MLVACLIKSHVDIIALSQQDKGRPLPKFGEWDVNNPASAEGFTVIFNKARDEKKTTGTAANMVSPQRNETDYNNESYPQYPPPKVCSIEDPRINFVLDILSLIYFLVFGCRRGGFAVFEATVVSGS